jgi:hypothetical protein
MTRSHGHNAWRKSFSRVVFNKVWASICSTWNRPFGIPVQDKIFIRAVTIWSCFSGLFVVVHTTFLTPNIRWRGPWLGLLQARPKGHLIVSESFSLSRSLDHLLSEIFTLVHSARIKVNNGLFLDISIVVFGWHVNQVWLFEVAHFEVLSALS